MKKSNYEILKEIIDDHIRKQAILSDRKLKNAEQEMEIILSEVKLEQLLKENIDKCNNSYEIAKCGESLGALDKKKQTKPTTNIDDPLSADWRENNSLTRRRSVDESIAQDARLCKPCNGV